MGHCKPAFLEGTIQEDLPNSLCAVSIEEDLSRSFELVMVWFGWLDRVLDLLPDCVSSVYFFYHESLHVHNPGKLSAMQEIALALEGGYRWWYSGYYVHPNLKQRYKMDYRPQYLLDLETNQWDLVDEGVLALLDRQDYVSLSRERKMAKDRDEPGTTLVLAEDEADQNPGQCPPATERDSAADATAKDEKGQERRLERIVGDRDNSTCLLGSNMPGVASAEQMREVTWTTFPSC